MAYQTRDIMEAMEEDSGIKINALKVDGGATANKYLLQFQADILGIPVLRPTNPESTALGAARLSGLEVGYYSMEDFENTDCDIYSPNMTNEKVNELYARWKKAVKATQEF